MLLTAVPKQSSVCFLNCEQSDHLLIPPQTGVGLSHEHPSFAPGFADLFPEPKVAVAEGFIQDHTDLARVDLAVLAQYGSIRRHYVWISSR